jgi:ABC-type transport system involved in cytochrome c biogenesis permease subunit
MTFGVALGMFAFRSKVGTEFPVEPKVLATVAVWLINGFYLAARLLLGWKRRRAAWISLAAFAALVFSVAVAPLVGRGFHDF